MKKVKAQKVKKISDSFSSQFMDEKSFCNFFLHMKIFLSKSLIELKWTEDIFSRDFQILH